MKQLLLICLSCLLYANAATGQVTTQPVGGTGVFGTVKDQRSNIAVAYVSVSIKNEALKIISGGITDEQGMFRLDGIPAGTFSVEFSIVGYQTLIKPLIILPSTKKLDLGILLLQPDATQLREVNITTEKSAISLKLDKKVFEVGKDILAQGGSVNDILNSVPSVAVNPAGAVSLRGNSNVLVMINGRRSGLTQSNSLDQIPAGQIERIEVITNPSSRYDAAGSAGIINIVMKKNKADGFSGQLRMVGGIPNDSRINPSLNYKSDKFNLFSTFGMRKTDYKGLYTTNQSTTRDINSQSSNSQNINTQDINSQDITTYIDQVQYEKRHDDGKLLYLGGDYFIDAQNTITAAFYKNSTHDHDKTSLNYNYMNQNKSTDSTRIRNGESWERRNYNQLEFNYIHTFKQAGKKFTADMQYDFWNSDKNWQLDTRKVLTTAETLPPIRTSSIGASKDFLIQTDFVQPLNEKTTFEMGLKAE
ncbi:MAG TPA: carboxypeptidase-like regulatory domain-containing protein, partial [Pedobacter sp.]